MSDESNPLGIYNENDPDWNNPQFQRRVLEIHRVWNLISNVHEATLECGHQPLLLGDKVPEAGGMHFCSDCREESKLK